MTNQTKNVPELRFPEFDGEWEGIFLNKLGVFKKNYTFSRANEGEGTLRHIHYGDIHSKFKSKIEKIELLPSISVDIEHPQLVQNNDLIFADASEDYDDLGKAILMKVNNGNVIAGLHTHLFSPNNNLNPEFLLYFTQTKVYRKFIKRQGVGISVLGISKKNLDKLLVNLPNYNEQQKIGGFFSKLDQQIELEEQKLEKLEEQKKGYMQKIFSQELRFKDENGNDYPEWEIKKLMQIAKVKTGSKNVQDNIQDGKFKFFDRSVEVKYLNTFDFDETAIIYPGEGSKFLPRYFSGKYSLHQRAYSIYDININNNYLYYYLSLQNNHFLKYAVGSTVKSLRMSGFDKLKVMVPKNSEQEKIGDFFNELDELIEKQSSKIGVLKQRKKGFLQKMFV